MNKQKINFKNLTRFKVVRTNRSASILIAQYSNNSIIALEQDHNTGVITEIRSPLLNSFFKMLQWVKATEDLTNYSVYVNMINKQYND